MTPAETLAERTHAHRVEYAPWLDRETSRRALAEQGLPEPRCEAWRYSNPNRWYEQQLPVSPPAGRTPRTVGAGLVDFGAADDDARTLVREHLHTAADRAKHPLATVNDIAMRLGLLVHVPGSDAPAEIELGDLGAGIERILVVLEPNASATLLEHRATPTHRVVECVLGEGAHLDHVRLQPSSESVEYHLVLD